MNRLKFNRGYLCGAMDRVRDGGVGWRATIQDELADLEVLWLDPTNKPINLGIEDLENRKYRHKCKEDENWPAVRNDMRIIRSVDLRMVDISDFLIVNLDADVHACGTYEELFLANRQKKPIIVHVEQGKQACPDWLFGTIPHEMIFSTWPQVHEYLRHVAHDPVIEDFRRWYFFNFNLTREL
jgi:hypothetical protein